MCIVIINVFEMSLSLSSSTISDGLCSDALKYEYKQTAVASLPLGAYHHQNCSCREGGADCRRGRGRQNRYDDLGRGEVDGTILQRCFERIEP